MRFIRRMFVNVLIPIALLLAPVCLPNFQFSADISTLLTVVSLLFAILVGFFIATATTNYLRLQTLIAEEDGGLIALYNLGKLAQPSARPKLVAAIDQYVIAALDFELSGYVEKTSKEFQAVVDCIDKIRPQNERGAALLSYLHEKKINLYATRQEIALAARRIVTGRHWFIIVLLAMLIIGMLLAFSDGTWLSALITGILSLATYLVLVLIYEIDADVFLEQKLAYENSQQVFSAIGKPKYYPAAAIKTGRVKPVGKFRIGVYVNYPESMDKKIKIIQ